MERRVFILSRVEHRRMKGLLGFPRTLFYIFIFDFIIFSIFDLIRTDRKALEDPSSGEDASHVHFHADDPPIEASRHLIRTRMLVFAFLLRPAA